MATLRSSRSFEIRSDASESSRSLRVSYAALRQGLEVKPHRFRLKTHRDTFLGKEAVAFMLENGIADSVSRALQIGSRLIARKALTGIQTREFRNDGSLYRFSEDDVEFEEDVIFPGAVASSSGEHFGETGFAGEESIFASESNSVGTDPEERCSWISVQANSELPPLWGHVSVMLSSTELAFIGGAKSSEQSTSQEYALFYVLNLHTLELEDRSHETREGQVPHLQGHSAVASQGMVYLYGGKTNDSVSNRMFVYDCDRRKWVELVSDIEEGGDDPPALSFHTCALWVNPDRGLRSLIVFGGSFANAQKNDHVYMYDIAANIWYSMPTQGAAPTGRSSHAAVIVGRYMFIFGGEGPAGDFQDTLCLELRSMRWIPVMVTAESRPPSARHGHCMLPFGNAILLHGGISHDLTFLNTTHAMFLQPIRDDSKEVIRVEGTWFRVSLQHPPTGRFHHSLTLLADTSFMLYGGAALRTVFSDLSLCRLTPDVLMESAGLTTEGATSPRVPAIAYSWTFSKAPDGRRVLRASGSTAEIDAESDHETSEMKRSRSSRDQSGEVSTRASSQPLEEKDGDSGDGTGEGEGEGEGDDPSDDSDLDLEQDMNVIPDIVRRASRDSRGLPPIVAPATSLSGPLSTRSRRGSESVPAQRYQKLKEHVDVLEHEIEEKSIEVLTLHDDMNELREQHRQQMAQMEKRIRDLQANSAKGKASDMEKAMDIAQKLQKKVRELETSNAKTVKELQKTLLQREEEISLLRAESSRRSTPNSPFPSLSKPDGAEMKPAEARSFASRARSVIEDLNKVPLEMLDDASIASLAKCLKRAANRVAQERSSRAENSPTNSVS